MSFINFYRNIINEPFASADFARRNKIVFRIKVDFNEMIDRDTVLLSSQDVKADSQGNSVAFIEGQSIGVYMEDYDDQGNRDDLIADGEVMRNFSQDWSSHVPWVLKINSLGIRRMSEIEA